MPPTYSEAMQRFLTAADDWLSDDDLPAIVTLVQLAEQLDTGGAAPAVVAQFGLAYRNLLKRKPAAGPEETDPIAKAMAEAGV